MRSWNVSAFAERAMDANANAATSLRINPILALPSLRGAKRRSNPLLHHRRMDCVASLAMTYNKHLVRSHLLLAVGDAIDGAVPVVGDQDRAIFQLQYINRAANILVVFEEAGDE